MGPSIQRRFSFIYIPGNPILRIEFPQDGQLRSRKIVRRSNARPTGKYPSWKMGRMVQWESVNELNAYRLLDTNPNVQAFHEQPLELTYLMGEKEHRHYPDVLVFTKTGKELWEIKPNVSAQKPDIMERTKLLSEALPEHGYPYRMVFAEDLARQPRLSTALTILKFGRADIPVLDREQLRLALATTPELIWGAVLAGALGPKGRNYACRLMLEGTLLWDSEQALNVNTVLRASCTALPQHVGVEA